MIHFDRKLWHWLGICQVTFLRHLFICSSNVQPLHLTSLSIIGVLIYTVGIRAWLHQYTLLLLRFPNSLEAGIYTSHHLPAAFNGVTEVCEATLSPEPLRFESSTGSLLLACLAYGNSNRHQFASQATLGWRSPRQPCQQPHAIARATSECLRLSSRVIGDGFEY